MTEGIKQYQKNLKLITAETVLTSIGCGFSISIMNIFWESLGMNQTNIGFVQMIYTIVILLLDIPMGYLADRVNRKILNIIGDIGEAFAFIYYAKTGDMISVIIAETLLAIFGAMTNGVDNSFLKTTCKKINSSDEYFEKVNSRVHVFRYIVMFSVMIIGGFVSRYSLRLSIGLSFIPYLMGGIIATQIIDYGDSADKKKENIFEDFSENIREIFSDRKTKQLLISYIIGKEVTHTQIWVFTPLMVIAGVPIQFISIGWILDQLSRIIGAMFATRFKSQKISTNFAFSISMVMFWIIVVLIKTNIFTVWLFCLNGFVVGYVSSTLQVPLQNNVNEKIQTLLMSIASTGARLIYVPLVYIINSFGNEDVRCSLVGVIVFFLPISIYVYKKLREIK